MCATLLDQISGSFGSKTDDGQPVMNSLPSQKERKLIQLSISQLPMIIISANGLSTMFWYIAFKWLLAQFEWRNLKDKKLDNYHINILGSSASGLSVKQRQKVNIKLFFLRNTKVSQDNVIRRTLKIQWTQLFF